MSMASDAELLAPLPLQFMPAVTIDMHGRFPFVLLRAADRSGVHKLLVRGKAGSTHAQLLQVGS
jgi:hypothetical protein